MKGIKLTRKNVRRAGSGSLWQEQHEFVCSQQGAGSVPKYVPKHPERKRNIPSKRTGCPCRLTVKTYPNLAEVLGMYNQEHVHEIGNENLKFTHLSKEAKDRIIQLLQLGMENDRIVCRSPLNIATSSPTARLRPYAMSN